MVGERGHENVIKPIWSEDGGDRLESNRTAGSAERNRITREGDERKRMDGKRNGSAKVVRGGGKLKLA